MQVGLEVNHGNWYLYSECSRHMMGQESQFSSLKLKEGGEIAFSGDEKEKIIKIGDIGQSTIYYIKNILLVKSLKHNLLSISQLCDKDYKVSFEASHCAMIDKVTNEVKFFGKRHKNVYIIYLQKVCNYDLCLVANINDLIWLWHRRLSHASYGVTFKLAGRDLVIGLPKSSYSNEKVCSACAQGKMTRISFKSKNIVLTTRALELLHLDLFGPTHTSSLGGKWYDFIIIEDYL